MQMLIVLCVLLVVIATVLPLSKKAHWIIRGMDFPRFQIMVFALITTIASIIFLDLKLPLTKVLIIINTLCLIWQIWWILPYTFLWKEEVQLCNNSNSKNRLSIITSNVLTPNRNAQALIDLVNKHKPDILVTLESDQWWEDQLQVLEKDMPHNIKYPLDNLYGIHFYSKLKIHDYEVAFLVEEDVPSIHVTLELQSGEKVRAHFIHPAPPSPTENTESAERDAELIVVAKSVKESKLPVIVSGDLNDVAWSSTTRLFRKISGLLDPRIGRGMFNTFHAKYFFMRWPLDHLFMSDHFTLHSIQRLPSIGSDHFPLYISIVLTPTKSEEQEGIEADKEDVERAKKITNKKNVSVNDVPQPSINI